MIKENILVNVLTEFFKKIGEDSQSKFAKSLNEDFETIMSSFNDYIVHKNLQMDNVVNMIDLHEAAKMIIDEVTAYKIRALKMHHKILTESTEMAKQIAMKQKK